MRTKTLRSVEKQRFPFVTCFFDYHEIATYAKELSQKYGTKISSHEIGCTKREGPNSPGQYWAAFWINGFPPYKPDVIKMLEDEGAAEFSSPPSFP